MLKVRITEYFESIVNQIDIFTEIKIQQDELAACRLNERRDEQIRFIKAIESASLVRVAKLNIGPENNESDLISKVLEETCFVVEFAGLLFLASVDRFVDSDEIDVFKKLIMWSDMSDAERWSFLTKKQNVSFNSNYIAIRGLEVDNYWTSDLSVVNVSSWFNQDTHIEKLIIEGTLGDLSKDHMTHKCDLKIATLENTYAVVVESEMDKILETVQFMNNCFYHVDTRIIHLRLMYPGETINSFLKSIHLTENTKLIVSYESPECLRVSDIVHYSLRLKKSSLNEELALFDRTRKDIESIDLSTLQSLTRLDANKNDLSGTSLDWSFLDPVRETLVHLECSSNRISYLSWTMFRGMHNLVELRLDEKLVEKVDLDVQRGLFTHLTRLRKLKVYFTAEMLSVSWCCDLPELEELVLTVCSMQSMPYQDWIKVRFNMPKLANLSIRWKCYSYDISRVLSCFSHVKHINLRLSSLSSLRSGWLSGFKNLQNLELASDEYETLYRHLFIGLESIKELEFLDWYKYTLEVGALNSLINLQAIRLWSMREEDVDTIDIGLFSGLPAIREISLSVDDKRNQGKFFNSFSYNQQAKKYFLVKKSLDF